MSATVVYVPATDVNRGGYVDTVERSDYEDAFAFFVRDALMPNTPDFPVFLAVTQAAAGEEDATAPHPRAAFSLAGAALFLDGEDDQVDVSVPPLRAQDD